MTLRHRRRTVTNEALGIRGLLRRPILTLIGASLLAVSGCGSSGQQTTMGVSETSGYVATSVAVGFNFACASLANGSA